MRSPLRWLMPGRSTPGDAIAYEPADLKGPAEPVRHFGVLLDGNPHGTCIEVTGWGQFQREWVCGARCPGFPGATPH